MVLACKKETRNGNSDFAAGLERASVSRIYQPSKNSLLELEYSLKKDKSLSVIAEEEENGNRFVGAGPKLKF